MRLFNINENNIDNFFKLVEECEGKVELVADGFRVDLKSRFAQYVSVAKIFFNKEVDEVELLVYKQRDIDRLMQFMIDGE